MEFDLQDYQNKQILPGNRVSNRNVAVNIGFIILVQIHQLMQTTPSTWVHTKTT